MFEVSSSSLWLDLGPPNSCFQQLDPFLRPASLSPWQVSPLIPHPSILPLMVSVWLIPIFAPVSKSWNLMEWSAFHPVSGDIRECWWCLIQMLPDTSLFVWQCSTSVPLFSYRKCRKIPPGCTGCSASLSRNQISPILGLTFSQKHGPAALGFLSWPIIPSELPWDGSLPLPVQVLILGGELSLEEFFSSIYSWGSSGCSPALQKIPLELEPSHNFSPLTDFWILWFH